MAQRFLASNVLHESGAALSASAQDSAHPLAWLLDQSPAKPWRSPVGWTFIAGFNASGTVEAAGTAAGFTIAPGYYLTPASVCAAVVTALEAIHPGRGWGCTYGAGRFTVSANTTVRLLCATDRAFDVGMCWPDLGFSLDFDHAAATSHESDEVAYQSRHYVGLTRSTAQDAAGYYVLGWRHGGLASARWQQSATSVLDAARTAFVRPALTLGDRLAISTWDTGARTTARHFALVLNNVSDMRGYTELAQLYFGPATSIAYCWTFTGYAVEQQDLSSVTTSVSGAHGRMARATRRAWSVDWDAIPEADMETLRALKASHPRGRNLWVMPDHAAPATLYYAWMDTGPNERMASSVLYSPVATFLEVLP